MTIRVLKPDVAAKIAAGEVVERPASVVKELVENSIDAGASRIDIEIKGGGVDLIRVTDDGCGIPADEILLSFHRHATSKLTSPDDLEPVTTMGFRGEALPSVASVSRVTMTSRPASEAVGTEVRLRWGEVEKSGPAGCTVGTSVSVESLFENVPARRKFLRSPGSERSRISDLVARFALAFPRIRFNLNVEGRNALATPGNGILSDVVISVYGAETAGAMLEVSWDGPDGYSVHGFTGTPSLHRANRSYITFIMNGRWIQSPFLTYALTECYQGFLPVGRHPMSALMLTVPPAEVDVNVHPAKREVRFRREDRVFSGLQRAVRSTLVQAAPVREFSFPSAQTGPPGRGQLSPQVPMNPDRLAFSMDAGNTRDTGDGGGPLGQPATAGQGISSLRVLGQIRNTYLVSEGPDGVYLIDQHAAHERVLFETVSGAMPGAQSQALLEPVAVELSPGQEELARSSSELLERYGFLMEGFGERSYILRAVPAVIGDKDPGKALVEVLDLMAFEGLVKEREQALAASIACHGAVRAGMSMDQREMEALLVQLEACENPHTCPHGRPTIMHLSSSHLEREFGRR